MASSIISTTLQVGSARLPVVVKAASESKEAKIDRAAPDGEHRLCRIDVPDPGPEAETIHVEPVRRDKKGKIVQAQYDGEPRRGVWQGDSFHEIAPEQLQAIEDATQMEAIEIQDFVRVKDVPWERVTGAYFLAAPEGFPAWPLAVIAKALRKRRAAGVTRIVLRSGGRQRLAVVHAVNGGLMVNTLHYAAEFRSTEHEITLDDTGVVPGMVGVAEEMIESRIVEVEKLDEFSDEIAARKAALIADAVAGKPIKPTAKTKAEPTVTGDRLMESLRASVKQAQERRKASAPVTA